MEWCRIVLSFILNVYLKASRVPRRKKEADSGAPSVTREVEGGWTSAILDDLDSASPELASGDVVPVVVVDAAGPVLDPRD